MSQAATPAGGPPVTPFGPRLVAGLTGVLLAAMMSGLANRVGSLALADMRGVLGLGADEAAWLNSVYLAGEFVAMPFSCWLAITFSLRRFHISMVLCFALLAFIMPLVHSLPWLLALRAVQGLCGGMLIPVLMMAALRFLPAPIRLHGLALYALTATFSPNLAFWLNGLWTDAFYDWRWVYWQSLPMAALALPLVAWGIPQDPIQLGRLRSANWLGMILACIGLSMLALGLDRGARLDWWRSDLIIWLIGGGCVILAAYVLSEWFHPAPFMKPQMMGRRNLGIGFSAFVLLLMVMLSASLLPSMHLERIWGYRPAQIASLGLVIALPQLALGSLVAILLYQRWVDARYVFIGGLLLIAIACGISTQITVDWIAPYFWSAQILQALGQPMAVVAMLFLCTSVVAPPEGQYVAGLVNVLRVFGTLFGGAVVGHFLTLRERLHSNDLNEQLGQHAGLINLPENIDLTLRQQAQVLASADAYALLGVLAVLLIIPVLCLQKIPAPTLPAKP